MIASIDARAAYLSTERKVDKVARHIQSDM